MKGLAVLILDALDIDLVRHYNMKNVHDLYMENGNILVCSVFPHTQTSNILIWSGKHRNWFWMRNKGHKFVDPAREFDRDNPNKAIRDNPDVEIITEDELDFPFIWNIAEDNGLRARAVQIPVTLPPLSFNEKGETDAWFPYDEERLEQNRRDKHKITMNALEDIANNDLDFYATSFPSPDKALHAVGEGHASEDFPERELPKLDRMVREVDEFCRKNDIGYAILGDHGAPGPIGPKFGKFEDQKIAVVRHRKHSIICGNMDDYPTRTDQMFSWMKEKLGIE